MPWLNDLPVNTVDGATIYIRDVAHVRDGFSPADRHRAAGRQPRGADDDLENRQSVHAGHRCKASRESSASPAIRTLPKELKITPLFDQSLFVRASIQGVLLRGLVSGLPDGADDPAVSRRSGGRTLIICVSIPLSIFVSVIQCSSALGETFNIMTLGGLALAVGILVDDATVEIENIEAQHRPGARNSNARFSMARSRSQCRPSSLRFASASCLCQCSF